MATNFINNILSSISPAEKETVYLSITPNVGLELALIAENTNVIKKYGVKPLEYNEALKEISNIDEFKDAVEDLFSELNIKLKSNVVLSIPTVHIGKIELPLILSDDMVNEAIISEVEQTYIFNRCEPVICWNEVLGNQSSETRTMIYGAVQKKTVEAIKNILGNLGANLVRLEISLTSALRALSYTGIASQEMEDDNYWTLMTVKSNGYELVQMKGKQIADYYYEPLPLKTYEYEEVYDAINTSAQISLLNFDTTRILIISDTDMVSAEHLSSIITTDGEKKFYENNNNYRKTELLQVSLDILPDLILKISLFAIGVAALKIHEYPSEFEFSGNKQEFQKEKEPILIIWAGKEYLLTESIMVKIIGILAAALIVPAIILYISLSAYLKNEMPKLDAVNAQIQQVDAQINEYQNGIKIDNFDINGEIEKVIRNNRSKLIAYSAIGESVPKKLWLNYFVVKDDGKIDIVGTSKNVEDIYLLYRNLKDSIINSQLRLHKLEMTSNSIDDAVNTASNYKFEITNFTENMQLGNDDNNINQPNDNNEIGPNDNNNNQNKPVQALEEVEVH